MKKYFYISFFALFTFINCSKNKKEEYNLQKKDTISDFLTTVGNNPESNQEKARYLKNVFSVLKNQKNTETNRENLLKLTARLNDINEYEFMQRANILLLKRAIEDKDTSKIGFSY